MHLLLFKNYIVIYWNIFISIFQKNLAEYYSAIDFNNMMIIFASMLFERRIIVKSERLSRLSACVQAANSMIYPMTWQHIFIPVLPEHLKEYLLAPMPFLIGVASSLFKVTFSYLYSNWKRVGITYKLLQKVLLKS